jgi:hypothetical protein
METGASRAKRSSKAAKPLTTTVVILDMTQHGSAAGGGEQGVEW